MNMSMGGSKTHACMQHATLTCTHGRTQHSRTHAAHNTRRNTHAHTQVLSLLPTSVKECTFRDLHIDQGIINAQKLCVHATIERRRLNEGHCML